MLFVRFIFVIASLVLHVKGTSECPPDEEIIPCTCEVDSESLVKLDCSQVSSENELARIFSRDFPSNDFFEIKFMNNHNLKTLHRNIFGKATFQEIVFIEGSVEVVESGALIGSANTLTKLQFRSHKLRSFPFEEIGYYRNLSRLYLGNNKFNSFPRIVSTSVKELNLAQNPLKAIPPGGLYGMPNLEIIYLYECEITEVPPGTFTALRNLYFLTLTLNNLTEIRPYSFRLHSDNGRLFLVGNNISKIAEKSMSGVSYFLNLDANNLEFFDEGVYRPILEGGARISIIRNPLACGCDIAWLVRSKPLMTRIFGNSTCSDGTLLATLDSNDYIMC